MIIGLTGMPGSGKGEFVAIARGQGYEIVRMGDIVWDHVRASGIELNSGSVAKVASAERVRFGPGIWAERTLERIGVHDTLIDGIRNIEELQIFKGCYPQFVLIAIHASQSIRHERIKKRKREDDTATDGAFKEREQRELGWGIEAVIALADYRLINDNDLDSFRTAARALLAEIKVKE